MQDKTNRMPKLEAGKHVVRYKTEYFDDLMLVVYSRQDGLSLVDLHDKTWMPLDEALENDSIAEVYLIESTAGCLKDYNYHTEGAIWERDNEEYSERKQRQQEYATPQQQIVSLQQQADKLGESL